MATTPQRKAAKRNVKEAIAAGKERRTIASLPKTTRSVLAHQAGALAKRKREGASEPKTRAELYEQARRRGIRGRSKMGRSELARALGES